MFLINAALWNAQILLSSPATSMPTTLFSLSTIGHPLSPLIYIGFTSQSNKQSEYCS